MNLVIRAEPTPGDGSNPNVHGAWIPAVPRQSQAGAGYAGMTIFLGLAETTC